VYAQGVCACELKGPEAQGAPQYNRRTWQTYAWGACVRMVEGRTLRVAGKRSKNPQCQVCGEGRCGSVVEWEPVRRCPIPVPEDCLTTTLPPVLTQPPPRIEPAITQAETGIHIVLLVERGKNPAGQLNSTRWQSNANVGWELQALHKVQGR